MLPWGANARPISLTAERPMSVSKRRAGSAGKALARGVWQAPWFGPDGQRVLLAVTSRGTLAEDPVVLPHGASLVAAADRLDALLERVDDVRRSLRLI